MQFTALRSTCAVHLRGQEKESSSLWQLLRLQTDQRVMSYTLYIISLYPSRVRNNSIPKCWKYLFITIRYAKFDFFFCVSTTGFRTASQSNGFISLHFSMSHVEMLTVQDQFSLPNTLKYNYKHNFLKGQNQH